MTDWELLDLYATGKSAAIEELIRRHIDLVYTCARRRLAGSGSAAMNEADDVTQAVFLLLTQKAADIPRRGSLVGWLYRATHFCCANLRKTESRRRRHETEAVMHAPHNSAIPALEAAAGAEVVQLLDAALQKLPSSDRDALLLHFLEQRTFEETGQAMGITAEAARKRTTRAVDRLRSYFSRLGFNSAAMGVGASLGAFRESAPAWTRKATLNTAHGHGSLAVAALAHGTSRLMFLCQAKLVSATAAAAILAISAIVWGVSSIHTPQPLPPAPADLPMAIEPIAPMSQIYADSQPSELEARNYLKSRLASLNNLIVHYRSHTQYAADTSRAGSGVALIASGSSDTSKTLAIRDNNVRYQRKLLDAQRTIPLPENAREFADQTFIFTSAGVQRLFLDSKNAVLVANIAVADQLPEPDMEAALALRGRTSPQRAVLVPLLTPDAIDDMTIRFTDGQHAILSSNRPGPIQDEWTLDRTRGYAPVAYHHGPLAPAQGDIEMRMSDFVTIDNLTLPRQVQVQSRTNGRIWRTEHLTVDNYALHDPANTPAAYAMAWPAGTKPDNAPRNAARTEIRVGNESFQASSLLASATAPGGSPSTPAPRDSIAWITRHRDFCAFAQAGDIQLLFLGDQAIQGFGTAGLSAWKSRIEPLHAANFGLAGDAVENVLWRVKNGELDGVLPRVVVLEVGGVDAAADSRLRYFTGAAAMGGMETADGVAVAAQRVDQPAAIAAGIQQVVRAIREKSPATRILLISLLPANAWNPSLDSTRAAQLRDRISAVNALLASLDNGESVRFLDLASRLGDRNDALGEGGTLKESGYQLWAEAMQPLLKEMLK